MDKTLKEYLEAHKIKYIEHKHLPVFTVEEHHKLMSQDPSVLHTKNLFLKDEKKSFFLVSMYANKQLDLKALRRKLHAKKKLSFASSEQLKENLNLSPGSVSIFGMINDNEHKVNLIVDKQVWEAEKVGFHPNINTSTLEISHEDLEKFYNSLKSPKQILDLDSPEGDE